ncbi:putative xylulokinase [Helianthus anomalus]
MQVFGITMDHKPSLDGHVVPNPVDPESYMVMFCYKTDIRDRCADKSWDVFNRYEASSNIERFVIIIIIIIIIIKLLFLFCPT